MTTGASEVDKTEKLDPEKGHKDVISDKEDESHQGHIAESEAETVKLDPSELHKDNNSLLSDGGSGMSKKRRKPDDDIRNIKKRKTAGSVEEEEDDDEDDEGGAMESAESKKQEAMRKDAIALLTEIEVDFAKLRDCLHEDKMARYVTEIEMCADGTHPELAKVAVQIEKIRNDKIQLAKSQRNYQLNCIDIQTRATRDHLHQQCFKDKGDVRHKRLLETTQEWYRVNKERRALDKIVPDYSYGANTDLTRGDQIRQRQTIFDTISNLSGIAKHIGFPAAPAVFDVNEQEVDYDLQAMGLRP